MMIDTMGDSMSEFDWKKNARADDEIKRIAVPVSPEMRKVLSLFRSHYPDVKLSDTKILSTFIEAGVRLWFVDYQNDVAQARANAKPKPKPARPEPTEPVRLTKPVVNIDDEVTNEYDPLDEDNYDEIEDYEADHPYFDED